MPPILFVRVGSIEKYDILSRLGFPINFHICQEHRKAISRPLLISTNRLAVELEGNELESSWINKLIYRARYYGVDLYIVATRSIFDKIGDIRARGVNVILKEAEKTRNIMATVMGPDGGERPYGQRRYLISQINAWEIDKIEISELWGIAAYVDRIVDREKILHFDLEAKQFEFISIDEFMAEHIDKLFRHLSELYGTKSLMANQAYRLYYQMEHGDTLDKKDSAIGFSIISLYLYYEL